VRAAAERAALVLTASLLLTGAMGSMPEGTHDETTSAPAPHAALGSTIAHLTVGVASLDAVLELWVGTFGFSVVERRAGPDAELGRLLGLGADRIAAQALVETPGVGCGRLHFVEFKDPAPPVRSGAGTTDLGPKNLDVVVSDLPTRYEELLAAGHAFRSKWVQYEFQGLDVREVQMAGPDATNVVFVELVGNLYPFTPQGFAGLGSFVAVVPDMEADVGFYRDLLGLPLAHQVELSGPEVEKMIGLPPGAGLDVSVLGPEALPFGRVELVRYRGAEGKNRYPLARPPALGALHAAFVVPSTEAFRARARARGVALVDHGRIDTIFGAGPAVTVHTPAGLRLDVLEQAR
jgi:catechol 2,3-dioxygenase-like lactoylglutathione lyase family enzyme